MRKPLPPTRRQGQMVLVLIASAGGLAGCGPDPNDAPIQTSRAEYTRVEDCIEDWGGEAECEFDPSGMDRPGAAASASRSAGSTYTSGTGHHNGGVRWLGPWFSQSGTVYRYDGRVEALRQMPTHAAGLSTSTQSVNQIYAAPSGRYATTSAHPQANGAKTARGRGGFGGTGRLFASGGG